MVAFAALVAALRALFPAEQVEVQQAAEKRTAEAMTVEIVGPVGEMI